MLIHIGNKNNFKLLLIPKNVTTAVRGWSGHLKQHYFFTVCVTEVFNEHSWSGKAFYF